MSLASRLSVCFLLWIAIGMIAGFPSATALNSESKTYYPTQYSPTLPYVTVSIPQSPQLGTWQIGLTMFSNDTVDTEIALRIIIENFETIDDQIEIQYGENYLIYTYYMEQFSLVDIIVDVEVLIALPEDTDFIQIYSEHVIASAAWQVPVVIYVLPFLFTLVGVVDAIRKYAVKRSEKLENAKMNERGDDEDKLLAFKLYLQRGLIQSAIRMAIDLNFPESVLQEIISSGPGSYSALTKVAEKYDAIHDYEIASRIYRHLTLESAYRRTSILLDVERGNMESAVSQFQKLSLSRFRGDARQVAIRLYEDGKKREAIFLCNSLGEDIRRVATSISKEPHEDELFAHIIKELDSVELKLDILCLIGAKKEAAEVISRSATLKEISHMSNLVPSRYRSEVVLLVIKRLAIDDRFSLLEGYLKALELTRDNRTSLISSIVRNLLDNPSNDNLRRLLKIIFKESDPSNKAFITYVLAASDGLANIAASKEIPDEQLSAALKSVVYLRDFDIRKKIIDKIHLSVTQGFKEHELSSKELAIYSQHLRGITYQIKGQISDYLKNILKPLEDSLRPIIQKDAKERVLHILIHPDEEMKLSATSKHLTLKLLEDIPMQNPTAVAQAFYELTRIAMFPELKKVITTIANNERFVQYVQDALKNAERRARLVLAIQKYERNYRPPMGTITSSSGTRITRQLAFSVWTERIHTVWVTGVFGALDKVVQNAMTRDGIPQRQKILLVAAYINRLHYAPTQFEDLEVRATFKRICSAASFSPEEQREVIAESKLPRHIASRLRF